MYEATPTLTTTTPTNYQVVYICIFANFSEVVHKRGHCDVGEGGESGDGVEGEGEGVKT